MALAELKQTLELIPNPAMLINTLPLLEARASSAIENIVTTPTALRTSKRTALQTGHEGTRRSARSLEL